MQHLLTSDVVHERRRSSRVQRIHTSFAITCQGGHSPSRGCPTAVTITINKDNNENRGEKANQASPRTAGQHAF